MRQAFVLLAGGALACLVASTSAAVLARPKQDGKDKEAKPKASKLRTRHAKPHPAEAVLAEAKPLPETERQPIEVRPQPMQAVQAKPEPKARSRKSKRQVMSNYADLQYFANISIGGQQISGIVDTGSFELVVFEKHCQGCGKAAAYDNSVSGAHSKGILTRGLYYGSGDIYAAEAFDAVTIGPFEEVNQSFWEAYEAVMPVLEQAHFQSIIGVGPPEMPSAEAWKQTVTSVQAITASLRNTRSIDETLTSKAMADIQFSSEISRTPTMLKSFGVTMFSLCLLNKPGSNGYFVWNDTMPIEQPNLFKQIPVMGRHTWTVNLTNVRMVPRDTLGRRTFQVACDTTCGAIVDSGTSLLMMPAEVVERLQTYLNQLQVNCSRMSELPDLVFALGGHTLSLPPDAYLAEVSSVPSNMLGLARIRRATPLGQDCQLSVMESYSTTSWGPLWILGMPLFRKYYTTFNTGKTHNDRSLFLAPSTPNCTPAESDPNLIRHTRHQEVYRRRLDVSRMYMSPLVKRALTESYIDL